MNALDTSIHVTSAQLREGRRRSSVNRTSLDESILPETGTRLALT
jgi:hypothetical protein